VLSAICLNDQSEAEMHEIDDVRADGLLAAEFLAIHAVGAQVLPEQLLGVCHVLAQGFGEFAWVHTPLPGPSPARGR
jgi:hypothetical protein